VDVRVFDQAGRFITDLTRDDFELIENGVPQQLQTLYIVEGERSAGLSTAATPEASVVEPRVPRAPATSARQTWIFVFDLDHLTPGGGFDRARKAVEDFIRDRFKEGDLAGVVAGTRMVNNRLTSVREELLAAVRSVKPQTDLRDRQFELTREWPRLQDEAEALHVANENREALQRAITRACTDDPDACSRVSPDMAIREKARRLQRDIQRATLQTLTAVNGLGSGLARMTGPKTIVFLSDGFVAQDLETTLRQVVGQTTRAGARIYAIDVRGLNRGRGAGIIDQPRVNDEVGGPASFDAQEDGPNSLAVDTGGLMIRNENNIERALDTIARDANRYYVLGYQPVNTTFDGKFRPIEVRVKRPGVRVRARRGYLALEPSRMLLPQPVKAPTEDRERPEPGGEPAPIEAAPIEPAVEPAPATAAGAIVSAEASSGAVARLRPDAGERVKTLSGGDLSTAGELATKAWDAYQRGDVETALPLLTQAAAQPDVRPWVLYTLGLSQVALGRSADAAASWERVRQAAPEFEPAYIDLARTYVQLSDLTKALAVLRDAERRWPTDPEIHNAVGVIHVRRGALNDAIAAFSKAADTAPDDALTYWNMGRAFELRYFRGRRYLSSRRQWVANDEDRRKAIVHYRRCVKLGGPYAEEATRALAKLEWTK
jgi:VWFA-related protein